MNHLEFEMEKLGCVSRDGLHVSSGADLAFGIHYYIGVGLVGKEGQACGVRGASRTLGAGRHLCNHLQGERAMPFSQTTGRFLIAWPDAKTLEHCKTGIVRLWSQFMCAKTAWSISTTICLHQNS